LLDTHRECACIAKSFDCADNLSAAFTQVDRRVNDKPAGDSIDCVDEVSCDGAEREGLPKCAVVLDPFDLDIGAETAHVPTVQRGRRTGNE